MLQDLGIKSTGATSLSFFLLKKKAGNGICILLNCIKNNLFMLANIKVLLITIEKNLNQMRLNQTSILAERAGVFYG